MAADDSMETDAPAATEEPKSSITTLDGLKKNVTLLQTAVQTSQLRLINRILRNNTPFRRNLRPSILSEAISYYLPQDEPLKALGLAILADLPDDPLPPPPPPPASSLPSTSSSTMEVDKDEKGGSPSQASAGKKAFPAPLFLPETTTYLLLLVLTTAMRLHRLEQAHSVATALLPYLRKQNRRTLDALAAKGYFYLALTQERRSQSLAPLRPLFVALHRTACLHHDEMGQATLLNLLLRSLLADNLIEQAGNLIARTSFPEHASNNQLCRYLYYVGRVRATQLDYTDAFSKLNQAVRKAPADEGRAALGFRREVTKLLVIVQLLLGDIPERATFDQPALRRSLQPYLALTTAVRLGDLLEFEKTVTAHAAMFKKDKTHTLILRLGHNVIKTGLRKISLSYSRISLAEIAGKLHLDGPASAEFVCAKAINDGVIDAVLDHEAGYLQSRDVNDIYSTTEPQQAFHKRITFCLDVHNEAVKSLRYPDVPTYGAKRGDGQGEEKGEEEKTEEELVQELEEDMEDEF
ncbi:hypothetical protein NSK_007619 [Nannochloropsis salina CCMP1776]|uniref:PCI domain-containing protein n=1 Tax=Nannochloropsis salina CCMP1776 TaxID=1027361 RepID=A0A4D9CQD6_9STRA|nr:hypothetical protein NSK_007619 [Nannochloropsis salina CCMP1776]|eukprot:TFJ80976.1 hypothetical protein NSK_007619 [Nannochloropsis salina CCMP1776]